MKINTFERTNRSSPVKLTNKSNKYSHPGWVRIHMVGTILHRQLIAPLASPKRSHHSRGGSIWKHGPQWGLWCSNTYWPADLGQQTQSFHCFPRLLICASVCFSSPPQNPLFLGWGRQPQGLFIASETARAVCRKCNRSQLHCCLNPGQALLFLGFNKAAGFGTLWMTVLQWERGGH